MLHRNQGWTLENPTSSMCITLKSTDLKPKAHNYRTTHVAKWNVRQKKWRIGNYEGCPGHEAFRCYSLPETKINTWENQWGYIGERERCRTKNENDAEQYVDGESSGASTEPNALGISSFMRRGSQLLFVGLVVDTVASSVWGRMSGERWGSAWHSTSARVASDVQ